MTTPPRGLHPRQVLAGLPYGRGGPGLWLADQTRSPLIGIDFCLARPGRRSPEDATCLYAVAGMRAQAAMAQSM